MSPPFAAPPAIVRPMSNPSAETRGWPKDTSVVRFAIASPLPLGLGDEAIRDAAVALRSWQEVRCTGIRAILVGTTTSVTLGDGVNAIAWHEEAWPAIYGEGALARTELRVDAEGFIREADVHVNGRDYAWSVDGRDGTIDLRSVLTHEFGHALGLSHSSDTGATMFAVGPRGLAWRSLEREDEQRICALYPGVGAPRCNEGGDVCPLSFGCIEGRCERPFTRGAVCAPCAREPGACAASGDGARCIDVPAGRVCAQGCESDQDCALGSRCENTTPAGDRACIPRAGCRDAPNRCSTDEACAPFVCREGICVGPTPLAVDAPDADASGGYGSTAHGGCSLSPAPAVAPPFTAWLTVALTRRRRRNRALPAKLG